MKHLTIVGVLLLAGCGVETLGTAATAAAVKQQDLEQGERTLDEARQRIDAASARMRGRQERVAEQLDGY